MPLPKPSNQEKRAEFVDRCMKNDETIKDFPDKKQRVAVCIGIYKKETDLNEASNEKGEALAKTYNDYPESASNNAKKVLRWRDEHRDEVKGMTQVGWARANQLAKRERISRETIARMASFKRHQKNAEIDPKYKATPWKDKGYVAWLGWGGTSGIEWASRKLKQIDKKLNSKMQSKQYGFSALNISESKIDKESGKMFGVSLISVGEALGHELFVDDDSIDSILQSIEGEKLPAYITHRGALFEDRLTREIGMFTNFRTENERLMADFEAFESFRDDDNRKFNRLFEMAEKMPERFGLSIVFSATQAWATPEGDIELGGRPEDALFDYPSIRVQEVSSADFVDTPAANQKGLFSKIEIKPTSKMLKSELIEANEKLSAENEALKVKVAEQDSVEQEALEAQLSTEEAQIESSNEVQEEASSEETQESFNKDEEMAVTDNEKTIGKGGSQGLEEGEDEEELEEEEAQEEEESLEEKVASLESVIANLQDQLKEKDEEMSKLQEKLEEEEEMKEKLSKVTEENSKLSSLIKGANPVEVSKGDDSIWSPSKSTKDQFIKDYAKENNISEFTATLRLGKEKPELFKL